MCTTLLKLKGFQFKSFPTRALSTDALERAYIDAKKYCKGNFFMYEFPVKKFRFLNTDACSSGF